jgi:hypothetical protein
MRATIDAKYARAKDRRGQGSWCRVTGSRARCDNSECRARGRGSLRVYRVAHSEHRYDHTTSVGKGGGVQHNMTQSTESDCVILCEQCKFRQMVQEHDLTERLNGANELPPLHEVVKLTGVQLDPERYEALRVVTMLERANPSETVKVPDWERRVKRERLANMADDLEPLPANAIG